MTLLLTCICIALCIIVIILIIAFRGQLKRISQQSEQQFRLLASEALDRNSANQRAANTEQLSVLLSPLKIRLEDLNRNIQDTHVETAASRRSLSDQIERLTKLNLSIGEEARNLSSALKGNTRIQGQWGETVLETILERAGLTKGINFDTQATRDSNGSSIKNEEGRALRPDMIIFLPDKRNIIVDAKTSLSAYLEYCEASSARNAEDALKRHIISIKRHIDELASKKYTKWVQNASEQVLMFIPNDGALLLAIEKDENLISYALERKIALVSPSQIMGVVLLVAQIWRKDAQDRNSAEIARLGGLLYDSAKDFINDLESIEKNLNAAHRSYESAISRLTSGSRSFLSRAERLRELGAKTSRRPT